MIIGYARKIISERIHMEYDELTLFDDPGELIIEGTVENIVYHNEENSYTVFSIEVDGEEVTCTGTVSLKTGEYVKLAGTFVVHPSYGRQFLVKRYENSMPESTEGIEKYLGSGVIKGVGVRLAHKIVLQFGEATLNVIEHQPEALAKIRGITMEKALAIGAVFKEQVDLRKVIVYLSQFGISAASAVKIHKKLGSDTIETVKTNPYSLADENLGIGFKTADSIAYRVGIPPDSSYRVQAGLRYILQSSLSQGHVFLYGSEIFVHAAELLDTDRSVVERELIDMQLERIIYIDKKETEDPAVYLSAYHYAEMYIAKKLIELSNHAADHTQGLDARIAGIESETGIKLAGLQKMAVHEAMKNGVLVITGGPGTGKTTTINTIIKLLKNENYEIALAAPTGRAAKRMTEATGMEAKTIHRLLEIGFTGDENVKMDFNKTEDDPVDADVVIIDESSMVDCMLMFNLLKGLSMKTRLILVGDVDQLPSVGAGNVLKDIIDSDCIRTVRLSEIFRQSQESAIVTNAHRINRGEYPNLAAGQKDFFHIKRANPDAVIAELITLLESRLPAYLKCDKVKDIQVLTPMRKSDLGVNALNRALQDAMNPPARNKKEKQFRNGVLRERDKVIQIKNNYNMAWREMDKHNRKIDEGAGVYNGDEGIITEIDDENETVTVCFDDCRYVTYDYSALEELELAYALTIHKAQGSEYKCVVLPIHSGPPMLLCRNLLYTAVTRAKTLCVIVGIPETLNKMVDNNRQVSRNTMLAKRIINYLEFSQSLGTGGSF